MAVPVPLIICQQADAVHKQARKCPAGVLGQTKVTHFRLTLQSLDYRKDGADSGSDLFSHRHFAAFDFIEFTAGLTGAVVEEVVGFRLFSVDQIL